MSVFNVVKENVTAKQVAEHYGFRINRNNMMCCPFHKDKNPSMKIEKRYYCFGCGEQGDATSFVAKYFNLTPKEAALKIVQDFGITYNASFRAPPKIVKPVKTKEQLLEEEQKYCYVSLAEYYHLLQKWKTKYAPKEMEEEFHPYYVEALQEIPKIEYQLDTLLLKEIPDRAFVISDLRGEVNKLERKVKDRRRSERDARG